MINDKKFITYDIEKHFINILIQKTISISDNFRQLRAINPISKNQVSQMMKIVLSKNFIVFLITCTIHRNVQQLAQLCQA